MKIITFEDLIISPYNYIKMKTAHNRYFYIDFSAEIEKIYQICKLTHVSLFFGHIKRLNGIFHLLW